MSGIVDFEKGVNVAAQKVVTLLAGTQKTVTTLVASDPLIAAGVQLAEHEVPGIAAAVGVFDAVLALANSIVMETQASAAILPPKAA
jgi:hypothetical protein